MKKKLYKQYCPMSYALDVIGDRWTLHIIRDLEFGARRFTDLHNGLPGLATNLLSKRLKEMEQSRLIVKKHFLRLSPQPYMNSPTMENHCKV